MFPYPSRSLACVLYRRKNHGASDHRNLKGHRSVLEASRHSGIIEHLVYASSSSVYGDRPIGGAGFREDEPCTAPVSLYAATKRSCELMSQSYATLYGLPLSGLRFFTVYGPWGRPDMARSEEHTSELQSLMRHSYAVFCL